MILVMVDVVVCEVDVLAIRCEAESLLFRDKNRFGRSGHFGVVAGILGDGRVDYLDPIRKAEAVRVVLQRHSGGEGESARHGRLYVRQ